MSSGKINMVFVSKISLSPSTTSTTSTTYTTSTTSTTSTTPTYMRMNRLAPLSMNTIIHRPASSCSSCGN